MNVPVCVGEASVSDTDSVSNRGTEPIILFRLGFVITPAVVLPVSMMGMGIGFCCCSFVFKYGSRYKRTWVHILQDVP